ncbi:aldo/keto reductase [Jiulongibacter sp. NS-SX5]|uniref:aldo/keto reductase n=1 Tax=Jiulongibacter sp. NS-SX5 TaxID=3463854 RepID=UPI0040586ED8
MNDNKKKSFKRRDFISTATLAGLSLSTLSTKASIPTTKPSSGKRMIGELEVSAIGLGCMSMTSGHYNPPRNHKAMEAVVKGAFDRGVTFFDTAEYYGPFTNEEVVGNALKDIRKQVIIASKFGFQFDGNRPTGRNGRPEHLKKAAEGMLRRLKTDYIDLLYLHRVDPEVPIEESAGAVSDLIKEGKVRYFGISETSPETIKKAHAVQKVTAVQSEYSLIERVHENQVIDTCGELGIGFVPWGPVTRGFLADKFNEYSRFSDDSRFASVSYYTPEAIANNMALLDLARDWGLRKGITPAQFSLAWLLAQRPYIVPIPGTTKLQHVEENMGAIDVNFTVVELKEFRTELEKIKLVGVREPESALTNK